MKFANTDSQANEQTLVLEGFENNGDMSKNQLNPALAVPANLTDDESRKTPTSNTLDLGSSRGRNELRASGRRRHQHCRRRNRFATPI